MISFKQYLESFYKGARNMNPVAFVAPPKAINTVKKPTDYIKNFLKK